MAKKLHGVVVPIITPVDDDDRVDEAAFRKVIRYVIGAGAHGVFAGGSAGEGPLFTMNEWVRLVQIAFDEANGKVDVLGGAIDTSTKRVLERIDILKQVGYTNIVVTPTFYTTLSCPSEHLRLFEACKQVLDDRELIAYNIPSSTYSSIPVEVIIEMARRGWIRYCKESSGNPEYYSPLLDQAGQVGLDVFMGDEANIAAGLLAGACGIVPVCANYEPETFVRAYEAGLRRDIDELQKMQRRVNYLRDRLPRVSPCWIAGVKYGPATLGIGSGKPVSPLQPLSADEKKIIDEMTSAKFAQGARLAQGTSAAH
jgi:4-hydroxy-tetrahydrodipicolinate synthase